VRATFRPTKTLAAIEAERLRDEQQPPRARGNPGDELENSARKVTVPMKAVMTRNPVPFTDPEISSLRQA